MLQFIKLCDVREAHRVALCRCHPSCNMDSDDENVEEAVEGIISFYELV